MASADSSERNLALKPGPLMLRDYLKDELMSSSSSSNGFRSFPRRQCCASTVQFLLEIDLKTKDSSRKLALSAISGLQRASDAVVRAFRKLPFPAAGTSSPPAKDRPRKWFLPRSLSRKPLLRSFWKKAEDVEQKTGRWRSFRELLNEEDEPSDIILSGASVTAASRKSTGGSVNSSSWMESEFTSEMTTVSSSGNSESSVENDAVKSEKDSPGQPVSEIEGATVGKDSTEEVSTTTQIAKLQQWASDEDKEQFSPVSVLDFPFDDEDPDISSSFNAILHLTGKRQKQYLQKNTKHRFKNTTPLEPLDLQKRFADLELHRRFLNSPQEHEREEKAYGLLKRVRSASSSDDCSFVSKTENLLLDFFHEKLEESEDRRSGFRSADSEDLILQAAEDWIDGEGEEMITVELQKGWSLYVEDMEKKSGKWRGFDEEKEELACLVEDEIWISLLHELMIEFL